MGIEEAGAEIEEEIVAGKEWRGKENERTKGEEDMMKRKKGWRKKGEKKRKWKPQPSAKQTKGLKKRNAPGKNLNVVVKPRNLKKRRQRRKAGEVILNQANLKIRRPRLQSLKV